jgi:predicted phosphoribosyltransferase
METETHIFADRPTAGRELARAILERTMQPPFLVLALPRGGVPVAYEVARALHAPLDVMVVRKIGMPGQPEFAIGAIASGDVTVRDQGASMGYVEEDLRFGQLVRRARVELARRERVYRGDAPPLQMRGRTVILVDDGLATGATMLAAVRAARAGGAARVVAAAPVASDQAAGLVAREADEVILVEIPQFLSSIGQWYGDFEQVEDTEVCGLLERARNAQRALSARAAEHDETRRE